MCFYDDVFRLKGGWVGIPPFFRAALPTLNHCVHPPKRWGIQAGAPETNDRKTWPKAETKSADSGDAKTRFVDARVETFNFADLAPTVQSRRDRDKKECNGSHLDHLWLLMSTFLQTVFCELFVVWRFGDIMRRLRFFIDVCVAVLNNIYIYIFMLHVCIIYGDLVLILSHRLVVC